jgi:putative N6-adenine-specific DNA methylase
MCGSGTIAIEAALMARNIAPGLQRRYRVEELKFYDADLLQQVRDKAMSKIYPSGKYTITASDIDPEMIQIAR